MVRKRDKFLPYSTQNINQRDVKGVVDVLLSGTLTQGQALVNFEDCLQEATGAKFCAAVHSGTAALHLACLALLNKGDRVITTPNSFMATSNAILYADAVPVFVDIMPEGNIDLLQVEGMLQKDKTIKAVIPVNFGGRMNNPRTLMAFKHNYGVKIIEDAAHSLGATFDGVSCGYGDYADATILSFHPVKTITTGEGGAVLTNDNRLANKILRLRSHGIRRDYTHNAWEYDLEELGFHYRMTELQAALGCSQLMRLDEFVAARRVLALEYHRQLKRFDINKPFVSPLHAYDPESAYHLFVVTIDKPSFDRNGIMERLRLDYNIGTQVHYQPINRFSYYRSLGYGREDLPRMYTYYERCLSLPLHPFMTVEDVKYVVDALEEVL